MIAWSRRRLAPPSSCAFYVHIAERGIASFFPGRPALTLCDGDRAPVQAPAASDGDSLFPTAANRSCAALTFGLEGAG
jgi:hypothetical protein